VLFALCERREEIVLRTFTKKLVKWQSKEHLKSGENFMRGKEKNENTMETAWVEEPIFGGSRPSRGNL
jgi:hypothetical protein